MTRGSWGYGFGMATEPRPDQQTEDEIEEDAATSTPDPITKREALETALIDEDQSEIGEHIGEHID